MAEQQEQQKHPGGRPRLEFDLRLVEDLGKIQSTQSELAAVLGCHLDTVKDRLRNDPEFSAAYEKGLENGKSSLRRIQWKAALGGNTTMQIWLGKQYLQQRDMHSAELTGAKGEPLIPAQMVTGLDDATRTLLRELRGRLPRTSGEESALPASAMLLALPESGSGVPPQPPVPDAREPSTRRAGESEGDP